MFERLARCANAVQVRFRPQPHAAKCRRQAGAAFGQFIFHPRRHHGVNRTRDQPISFHLTQCLGQHFLADPTDQVTQLRETQSSILAQYLERQYGPFVGDPNFGRFLNANPAEYVVPMNLDIGSIEVDFIDRSNTVLNNLGVKAWARSS